MHFLADESCDFAVVRALREAGHDVAAVAELDPGAEDAAVIARALGEQRVLLIQVLAATADAPPELWLALDKYHDRRNASEYEGAPPASSVEAEDLVKLTGELHRFVLARLKRKKIRVRVGFLAASGRVAASDMKCVFDRLQIDSTYAII